MVALGIGRCLMGFGSNPSGSALIVIQTMLSSLTALPGDFEIML